MWIKVVPRAAALPISQHFGARAHTHTALPNYSHSFTFSPKCRSLSARTKVPPGSLPPIKGRVGVKPESCQESNEAIKIPFFHCPRHLRLFLCVHCGAQASGGYTWAGGRGLRRAPCPPNEKLGFGTEQWHSGAEIPRAFSNFGVGAQPTACLQGHPLPAPLFLTLKHGSGEDPVCLSANVDGVITPKPSGGSQAASDVK